MANTDEGRRIIDQSTATRSTIAGSDAFPIDSNANGTRQITYTELVEAIKITLAFSELVAKANGAMQQSVYDADGDGIVDNAELVNNHSVLTDVPANAVFTDTIYDDTQIRELIAQKLNISDYTVFTGATTEDAGTAGKVPAPGAVAMYLGSEGAWLTPDAVPTENSEKLITSGAVYEALQNVEIDVDNAMSASSENPVQNKVIYAKMVSTAEADAAYHTGFYVDADGDLCQA